MKFNRSLWHFLWKFSRIQVITIFLSITIFITVYTVCWAICSMSFPDQWELWLEAFVTFNIVFLAVFIGYNEKRQDWELALPKKLTVHFIHDKKYIMTCHEAYLAGEDDIRQWGQQIGRQMAKSELDFYPYITQNKPVISKDKTYFHYIVNFNLKEIPKKSQRFPETNEKINDKYMIWIENQANTQENKEWYEEGHPEKSFSIEEVKEKIKNYENTQTT